ncbi:hypothetical protein [Hoeflea sp.]|uniref:hypothetical protein n=1 Tax=Hoeflea sp. TaxID=1940281 RepID=UPI003748B842
MGEIVSTGCCGWDGDHLSAAKGDGGGGVGLLRRRLQGLHVFPADAVPSFRALAGRMALDDIAAMDAVEGRAVVKRRQVGRGER